MSITLEHPAPGVPEVREALLTHANRAREAVSNLENDPDEEIHELRTRMKKVRALMRLLPLEKKPKRERRMKRLIRILKNELASQRDDHVLRKVYHTLAEKNPEDAQETAAPPDEATIARLLGTAEGLESLTASIPDKLCSPATVRERFLKTYRRGRRLMKRAREHDSPEVFHEWRKAVKELWYQASTLVAWEPNEEIARQARELSSLLGDLHDLDVLRGRLGDFAEDGEIDTVQTRLETRRTELRDAALSSGAGLFARKRGELAEQLD